MLIKLIVFLIRIRLGLKKYECFQFKNQKSLSVYYFTRTTIVKYDFIKGESLSGISLNWLLDPESKEMIIRRDDLRVNGGLIFTETGRKL